MSTQRLTNSIKNQIISELNKQLTLKIKDRSSVLKAIIKNEYEKYYIPKEILDVLKNPDNFKFFNTITSINLTDDLDNTKSTSINVYLLPEERIIIEKDMYGLSLDTSIIDYSNKLIKAIKELVKITIQNKEIVNKSLCILEKINTTKQLQERIPELYDIYNNLRTFDSCTSEEEVRASLKRVFK